MPLEKVKPNTAREFLSKLSAQMIDSCKIKEITDTLVNYEKIMPIFGAEIEFYLTPNLEFASFNQSLQKEIQNTDIKYDLVKEKGKSQFEIALPPSNDGDKLASDILKMRKAVLDVSSKAGGKAIFDAKPFKDDFGSALHFHISFVKTNNYLDIKDVRDTDYIDKDELKIIGRRMCCLIPDTFLVFAPDREDYKRFVAGYDSPVNVSFSNSNNNRTVPVRMPSALPVRLEHRVACAGADPYLVLTALMQGVSMGQYMTDRVFNVPIIEGSAYRAKYNLEPFPKDIDEACEKFDPRIFKM